MHLLTDHLYLFTTHLTPRKEIAIAAVVVVAILAAGFWLVRRRRSQA
jgi:hypothetical protein